VTSIPQDSARNILLRSLATGDYALLEPHLERLPLDTDIVVAEANAAVETV